MQKEKKKKKWKGNSNAVSQFCQLKSLSYSPFCRRKSKSKIQQSYLKKENSSQFEKVEQKFISDTDHVVNTGSVDDTSPSHVAALRKAFSAEENRAYSRHGREILKVGGNFFLYHLPF